MDNAPIHKPEKIVEEVSRKGCKVIYPSPFSPFLNLIKGF